MSDPSPPPPEIPSPAMSDPSPPPPESARPEEPSSPFVYVDDDGNQIDLAAETSYLMAAALDECGMEADEDPDAFFHDAHLMADSMRERTASFSICAGVQGSDDDEGEDGGSTGGAEPAEEETAAEETMSPATVDQEGMLWAGSDGASRGYDEDWVLDKILLRRKAKALADPPSPTDEVEPSPWEYLCRWRWYADPTWEPRTVLLDLGYGRDVAAYDEDRRLRGINKAKAGPQQPVPRLSGDELLPDARDLIESACRRDNLQLYAAAPLPIPKAFVQTVLSAVKSRDIGVTLLYHGTRQEAIRPIIGEGLRVGGTGNVGVRHGTAHGRGVYTARNPGFSGGYCDQGGLMFACIGLVSNTSTSYNSGSIIVFPNPAHICPAWLLHTNAPNGRGIPPRGEMPTVPRWHRSCWELLGETKPHEVQSSAPPQRVPLAVPSSDNERSVAHYTTRRMTKKTLKQAPRAVKDLYRQGLIPHKK